jgi:hypothetical protein
MIAIVTAVYKGFRRTTPKILFWKLTAKHLGNGGNSLMQKSAIERGRSVFFTRARKVGPFAVTLLGTAEEWPRRHLQDARREHSPLSCPHRSPLRHAQNTKRLPIRQYHSHIPRQLYKGFHHRLARPGEGIRKQPTSLPGLLVWWRSV